MKEFFISALALIYLSSAAHACESYEACIQKLDSVGPAKSRFENENQQNVALQAIIYKLDEISKKLDKDRPTTDWRHTLCQCGDDNNGGCNECERK